jgi:hypothetical protein
MKRTRTVLGVAFAASFLSLVGCGQGTYHIPAVEPVVKPKPGSDDLLADIAGGDDEKPAPTESKPSGTPPAEKEKAPEKAPEAPRHEATKPAEPAKAEPAKVEPAKGEKATTKPAEAKPAPAKPPADKPNGKK